MRCAPRVAGIHLYVGTNFVYYAGAYSLDCSALHIFPPSSTKNAQSVVTIVLNWADWHSGHASHARNALISLQESKFFSHERFFVKESVSERQSHNTKNRPEAHLHNFLFCFVSLARKRFKNIYGSFLKKVASAHLQHLCVKRSVHIRIKRVTQPLNNVVLCIMLRKL